jgi:cytochrome c2
MFREDSSMSDVRSGARRWLPVAVVSALLSMPFTAAWAGGDPDAGKQVFKQNCSICHSPLPGKVIVGPPLFGVVGRPTTSVPGYNYSPANAAAHLIWTPAQLDKYIENPQKIVPGTKMTFPGLPDSVPGNAEKRANLIAFLSTLK